MFLKVESAARDWRGYGKARPKARFRPICKTMLKAAFGVQGFPYGRVMSVNITLNGDHNYIFRQHNFII